jgi:hypothetical protein
MLWIHDCSQEANGVTETGTPSLKLESCNTVEAFRLWKLACRAQVDE